jgi:transglutaminase-like putative cysteine protease
MDNEKTKDMQQYIEETEFFNFSSKSIREYIKKVIENSDNDIEKAVRLYYAVRDGWRYNPYRISFKREDWTASQMFAKSDGHCQDKAALLVTFARACGIPARLHLAKVKNHIAVELLIKKLGTNVLTPHGYVELFLENKWVKATPAFNKELCVKLNVAPLEFDGKTDSFFQEYDKNGGIFMEYLEDYGTFTDLPLDFMIKNMRDTYPLIAEKYADTEIIDFSK